MKKQKEKWKLDQTAVRLTNKEELQMDAQKTLDTKGLACPMPIVKTKKAMKDMQSGEVLEVQATDKGAQSDLAAWAKSGGHELIKSEETDGVFYFWIKKA